MNNIENTTPIDVLADRVWSGTHWHYPNIEKLIARITALGAENATLQAKIGFMQTELGQMYPACSTCGATDHKVQSVCSNGFHALRAHELSAQLKSLEAELAEAKDKYDRLRETCIRDEYDIRQTLGKALGYPWFKDDQNNFPGATEENGVCVGEHVAVTLAMEAAKQLTAALATVEKCQHDMSALLARIHGDGGHYESKHGTEKARTDAGELVANLRAMLSESKAAAKGGGE